MLSKLTIYEETTPSPRGFCVTQDILRTTGGFRDELAGAGNQRYWIDGREVSQAEYDREYTSWQKRQPKVMP